MKPLTFLVASFMLALTLAGTDFLRARAETPPSSSFQKVIYIPVNTEVQYGLSGFIKRALAEAKENQANAIILGIDTFGGRVDSALDIVNNINDSGIPVTAYVLDKAWSAGAMIALGCKAIYMKPGSSIGSATPVSGGGPTGKTKALGEKYVSAIRAKFRSIAEKNGYPPNLAAAMVDRDMEVKEVVVGKEKRYLTDDEIDLLKNQGKKIKIGPVITEKGKLLNLTADQAVDVGLAKGLEPNMNGLLAAMGLPGAKVINEKRNWAEHFASFITGSMMSGLLLLVGLVALYTELTHPGFGWAGVIGLVCLGLLFWGKYVVNLAQMTDVVLFLIGVVLLLVEIFVIPGFGITGILGLLFMAAGLYLAFVPFVLPKMPWDFNLFYTAITILLLAGLGSVAGFLTLMHFLPELPGLKRLVLTTALKPGLAKGEKGPLHSVKVGQEGEVLSDLRPVGKARFATVIVDAVAETGYLNKGAAIKIIKIEGNRIVVREIEHT